MAGTIPSLSLSMQFDKDTGKQLKGGKLHFFAANTQTPQNVYQDTALTILHPNPITLDGAGRIPEFFLADGTIHFRLTNSAGTVQIEGLNSLVVGPSSGGGGGGPAVDPTTIFQTGDVMWLDFVGTRSGWVRDNGRTIGSGSSGATERANADTQNLFVYLWSNFADSICPVLGGRGASGASDFSANKQITLPDKRGYLPAGLDDMGNTLVNRFAGVPLLLGTTSTGGAKLGESTHGLTFGEIPAHTHTANVNDPGHTHTMPSGPAAFGGPTAGGGAWGSTAAFVMPSNTTGITVDIPTTAGGTSAPGGGTHNNTPLVVLGTFFRKL